MLLLGAALALSTQSAAKTEEVLQLRTQPCLSWLSGRHDSHAVGETHRAGPALLCFDGVIDQASARSFIEGTGHLTGSRPVIVVRSVGGDVDAALTMADAIRRLGATVVASQVCLSSCANFVVAAGKKRVIREDSILGFHGGAMPTSKTEVEKTIEAEGKTPVSGQVARVAGHLNRTYERQQSFLAAEHIDPNFFSWMGRFNTLPAPARHKICPGLSGAEPFLVLSSDVLARHGYKIDVDREPGDAAGLSDLLKKYGIPVSSACFIGASSATW